MFSTARHTHIELFVTNTSDYINFSIVKLLRIFLGKNSRFFLPLAVHIACYVHLCLRMATTKAYWNWTKNSRNRTERRRKKWSLWVCMCSQTYSVGELVEMIFIGSHLFWMCLRVCVCEWDEHTLEHKKRIYVFFCLSSFCVIRCFVCCCARDCCSSISRKWIWEREMTQRTNEKKCRMIHFHAFMKNIFVFIFHQICCCLFLLLLNNYVFEKFTWGAKSCSAVLFLWI